MTAATAPGKIMLAGEYAVLDGATAVLVAIDLRVRATVAATPPRPGGFLAAVAVEISGRYGDSSAAAIAARSIVVDSAALFDPDGRKLGLGSSAAVTVAAVAASLAAGGGRVDLTLVHDLAHRAHGRAQAARGGRGSGADIAASVYGGAVVVGRRASDPDGPLEVSRRLLPRDLHLALAWTGAAADTTTLIARAAEFEKRHPAAYRRALDPLAEAASELAAALAAGDAVAAVAALAAGGRAAIDFGATVAIPIESPLHRQVRAIAEKHGGAAKPTGAGVGDVVVAAFTSETAAESFRNDARARGIPLITAPVALDGVRIG